MNLIGNNCAASFIQKFLNEPFRNPFVWCAIRPKDIIYLIKNYKKIDFTNVELVKIGVDTFPDNELIKSKIEEERNIYGVKIDNKIIPYFTHYLFDENYKEPIVEGIDTFYYLNNEYVLNKYHERLKRNGLNENPIFLIVPYKHHNWNEELIKELCELKTDYKIILISNLEFPHNDNLILIKDDMTELDTEKISRKYFNEIRNILKRLS